MNISGGDTIMKINKQDQLLLASLKQAKLRVPEPPRQHIFRFHTQDPVKPWSYIPTEPADWLSFPLKLDLTKDFTDKTPMLNGELFLANGIFYFIPEAQLELMPYVPEYISVGPVYVEDTQNQKRLTQAMTLGKKLAETLEATLREKWITDLAGLPKPKKPRKKRGPNKKRCDSPFESVTIMKQEIK